MSSRKYIPTLLFCLVIVYILSNKKIIHVLHYLSMRIVDTYILYWILKYYLIQITVSNAVVLIIRVLLNTAESNPLKPLLFNVVFKMRVLFILCITIPSSLLYAAVVSMMQVLFHQIHSYMIIMCCNCDIYVACRDTI